MKKKTTLKKDVDYTVETYEGRISVRLLQRGENGYFQSASCPYPNYEHIYNEETGTIEIIKLNGSVELAPLVGLSDVIVDIVETGKTLKENGLDVLEDVCPLSARFVVNKVSMKMEKERIMNIVKKFKEQIQ